MPDPNTDPPESKSLSAQAREFADGIVKAIKERSKLAIAAGIVAVVGVAFAALWNSVLVPLAYDLRHPVPSDIDRSAFVVVVADLEGERGWTRVHSDSVAHALGNICDDLEGVQLARVWRSLKVRSDTDMVQARRRAIEEWQGRFGFDMLLWGGVRPEREEMYLHLAEVGEDGRLVTHDALDVIASSTAVASLVAPVIAGWIARGAVADAPSETGDALGASAVARLEEGLSNLLVNTNITPPQRGALLRAYAGEMRAFGELRDDTALIERSVDVSRQAVTLLPQRSDAEVREWGLAQNALGHSLSSWAESERGPASARADAVIALDAARTAFDRIGDRDRAASARINLAVAIGADSARDEEGLRRSVGLLHEAEETFVATSNEIELGRARHNLGDALVTLARVERDAALYHQAVEVYEQALPQREQAGGIEAAETQEARGDALMVLSRMEREPALAAEAGQAYRAGLAHDVVAGTPLSERLQDGVVRADARATR